MGGHVVVVGSGPTGCAVARLVHDRSPHTRITMLEAGADPGADVRGQHVKNGLTYRASNAAPTVFDLGAGGTPAQVIFRPGTTAFGSASSWGMPAAAVSTNVGGMGAYWTCAAPSPTSAERAEQLSRGEWESALSLAKRLLDVGGFHFPRHASSNDIVRRLRTEYTELSTGAAPGVTPLAATTRGGQPYWVGTDTILADVLGSDRFELVDRAVCRKILTSAGVVKGVAMRRDAAERDTVVAADAVVVACGPFRTPQLLWASGIRPLALGRYLYEHRQILGAVAYSARPSWHVADSDRTAGMYQVPYSTAHPWHGQIMHFAQEPIVAGRPLGPGWSVLGLSWFVPMATRASNRVRFSDSHHDELGMPRGSVEFAMGAGAAEQLEAAIADLERAAAALGGCWVDYGRPAVQPGGYSLHVQGTTRLGAAGEAHTSVCDRDGRVHGYTNLFVAGTGTIPNETAANPTLTAVALSTRAAAAAVELVGGGPG